MKSTGLNKKFGNVLRESPGAVNTAVASICFKRKEPLLGVRHYVLR
jgi:hypothetical protein